MKIKFIKGFDSLFFSISFAITLAIIVVLLIGNRSNIKISDFSWKNQQIGIEDRYFQITFNRPINQKNIENKIQINPPLSGNPSWNGRNLTYTLTDLPVYGETYKIQFETEKKEALTSVFKTKDRAFAYLGTEQQEEGRLILYNLSKQQKNILTPNDLVVLDFAIYPDGEKILFSAFERGKEQGTGEQMLYTVTTGLNFKSKKNLQPQGKIQRILDNKYYQNFAFELSRNGQNIVIQRVNRSNPTEDGLWVIPETGTPRALGIPTGYFRIAPDGNKVAVVQPRGVALIPLTPEGGSLSFLTGYGDILAFSRDSNQKAMVKYNADYTRSLFIVNEQGEEKQLLTTAAPILACEFEPKLNKIIYCLKSDLVIQQDRYVEEPYLAAIDLETGKEEPLLSLPNYRDVKMDMSPDGIALLFDQIVTAKPTSRDDLLTEAGEAIAAARLWLLPLPTTKIEAEKDRLPPESLLPGFNPQWLQ